MDIEVGREVPHVDYCGFQFSMETISSSSEELFEDSNEISDQVQTNEIKQNDSSDVSPALSLSDTSDSETSLDLSPALLSGDVRNKESSKYAEMSSNHLPILTQDFSKFEKIFNDDREKELLHKMLQGRSETETQTEYPQTDKDQRCLFFKMIVATFMVVLTIIVIKDYGGKTGLAVINHFSKCCLCVFMSSAVNYFTSIFRQ